MKIFIDADACPVKEHTYRVAARYGIKILVVCNHPIHIPASESIEMVVTENRFDAVDDWIETNIEKNDIVITGDIPLAARCLKKEGRVINPRGRIYTEDDIGEAIATRELLSELRQRGEIGLGPQKMQKKNHSNFLSSLDLVINQVLKQERARR